MKIEIYGKQGCTLCESARKKVEHFLQRWDAARRVQLSFVDMETEDGAAEGDFFDVFDVPTVLLLKNDRELVARWDGKAPPSAELQMLVRPDQASSAA